MLLLKAALGFMLAGFALANKGCEKKRDRCFQTLRENPVNFKIICPDMLKGESDCLKTLEPICSQAVYTRAVYTFKAYRYYCQPSVMQVVENNILCLFGTAANINQLKKTCWENYKLSKNCSGLTALRYCLDDAYKVSCPGLCEVEDMFFYYKHFPDASEWNCVWSNTSDRCIQ